MCVCWHPQGLWRNVQKKLFGKLDFSWNSWNRYQFIGVNCRFYGSMKPIFSWNRSSIKTIFMELMEPQYGLALGVCGRHGQRIDFRASLPTLQHNRSWR